MEAKAPSQSRNSWNNITASYMWSLPLKNKQFNKTKNIGSLWGTSPVCEEAHSPDAEFPGSPGQHNEDDWCDRDDQRDRNDQHDRRDQHDEGDRYDRGDQCEGGDHLMGTTVVMEVTNVRG